MTAMTPEQLYQSRYLIGPWLAGCILEIFLMGVLCCQFSHYLGWYKDDKTFLKFAVAGLALLTLLKSIQSFALIWILVIEHFDDLATAITLDYTAWWQSGNSLMVAVIGLYVQSYFCYRLYVISNTIWVVVPIVLILLFAFVSIIVATYYITLGAALVIGTWFAAHLSAVFVGDLLMTCTTAYFLLRSKRNVLPQTVGLMSALIRLTFQTAAPAAICALFNLVFSQVYAGDDKIISTAFNQLLPMLYGISMMWTLNARRTIAAIHSSKTGSGNGFTRSNEATQRSRFRSQGRFDREHDVEMGNYGGIHVRTEMETVQHVDVRDAIHSSAQSEKTHDDDASIKKGLPV